MITIIGAFSRVYIWAHHFFDVIAGILIAVPSNFLAHKITEHYQYSWRIYLYQFVGFMIFMVLMRVDK
jgi:membrane-associated phospholipid phosphatase